MAFPNLRRKKRNRSARAERYATEVLRKVGSSNVPEMNFVIEEIRAKEQGKSAYEKEFDLWSPQWE